MKNSSKAYRGLRDSTQCHPTSNQTILQEYSQQEQPPKPSSSCNTSPMTAKDKSCAPWCDSVLDYLCLRPFHIQGSQTPALYEAHCCDSLVTLLADNLICPLFKTLLDVLFNTGHCCISCPTMCTLSIHTCIFIDA